MAYGTPFCAVAFQNSHLDSLISTIASSGTQLTKLQRLKLTTLATLDVHARDVISDLITAKVYSKFSFEWTRQLRLYADDFDLNARCCDAGFGYGCEYIGNRAVLVITPLTDKCYIALTQVGKQFP